MMIHSIVASAALIFILCLIVAQIVFGLSELGIFNDRAFNFSPVTIALNFFIYYAVVAVPLVLLRLVAKFDFTFSTFTPLAISICVVAGALAFGQTAGGVFNLSISDTIKMPGFGVLILIDRAFSSPSERVRLAKLETRKEFIRAIETGDFEKVKSTPRDLIDGIFNSNYRSLVAHAAAAGNFEMVKWFVEQGAKLDRESEVLGFAAATSTLEILKYLVENGAEPILDEESWIEFTKGRNIDYFGCHRLPIWRAGELGKIENFNYLLGRANLKTQNRFSDYLRACGEPPEWLINLLSHKPEEK